MNPPNSFGSLWLSSLWLVALSSVLCGALKVLWIKFEDPIYLTYSSLEFVSSGVESSAQVPPPVSWLESRINDPLFQDRARRRLIKINGIQFPQVGEIAHKFSSSIKERDQSISIVAEGPDSFIVKCYLDHTLDTIMQDWDSSAPKSFKNEFRLTVVHRATTAFKFFPDLTLPFFRYGFYGAWLGLAGSIALAQLKFFRAQKRQFFGNPL